MSAYFAASARHIDPHVAQTGSISRLRAEWGAGGAQNPEKRRQARLKPDFKSKLSSGFHLYVKSASEFFFCSVFLRQSIPLGTVKPNQV